MPSNTIAKKIQTADELALAHHIRYTVFVIGQNVPEEDEIDEHEDESIHFLAYVDGVPCGAARWRITENGVKLERFAVLERYRGQGVGSALVATVLADVEKNKAAQGKQLYLHAQLSAMALYSKFGFRPEGPMFQECAIDHYKMVR
ncbi:MAG: GNAT family N-acetyltransferase [Cyclobacteriaceae bacterium]|nr:GNAT family N-acetyltransferase [Cyclobacteriaceae bacterium]